MDWIWAQIQPSPVQSNAITEYSRPTIYPTLSNLCNALPLLLVKVDMKLECYDCLTGHPPSYFEEFSKWLIAKKQRGSKMTTSVEFSVRVPPLQGQRRIEVLLERDLPCPLFSWFLDNRKAVEEINGVLWTQSLLGTESRESWRHDKLSTIDAVWTSRSTTMYSINIGLILFDSRYGGSCRPSGDHDPRHQPRY